MPRFSLRTLLVLLALVAIAMAWVTSQLKWVRDRNRARVWIEQHGGLHTEKNVGLGSIEEIYMPPYGRAPWNLRLCGEESVGLIEISMKLSEQPAYSGPDLKSLFPEALFYYRLGDEEHESILFTTWVKVGCPSKTVYVPQYEIKRELPDHMRRLLLEAWFGKVTSVECVDGYGVGFNTTYALSPTKWQVFNTEREARDWLRKTKNVRKPSPSVPPRRSASWVRPETSTRNAAAAG